MSLPALAFVRAQGLAKVARTVAQQQLFQAPIAEVGALPGQSLGRQAAQAHQGGAVGVAHEAAVEVFVHVHHTLLRRARVDLWPHAGHLTGDAGGGLGMTPGQGLVHAPTLGLLRAQRVELADHHR